MKTIKPTVVLDYYDGIQVFQGCDAIGGRYVGMLLDTDGEYDRYLVTGVRPHRLQQFRKGDLDLRTLLLEAPGGKWYIAVANVEFKQPMKLKRQSKPLAETDWLPGEGYRLTVSAAAVPISANPPA